MNEKTYVEGFHDKERVTKMGYTPLGDTGLRISKFSLGGGPFGGIYESIGEEEVVEIVKEALKSGVNYIDTAPFYGQGKSEARIGKALKDIPREAYYIGTKVGRYDWDGFDFSAEKTRSSFEESLKLLGLEYVDVIQIHDIEYVQNLDQIINETLPTLQEFVKEGKARFIGITGYPLSILKEVIQRSKVKISTVLTYTRFTLIDDELLKYMPYFEEKGIGVINAAVVSLGLLTRHNYHPMHPANHEIKEVCKNAIQCCEENGYDIADLAIRYSMRLQTTLLMGVGSIEKLRGNIKVVTTEPNQKELDFIDQIRAKFFSNLRTTNWEWTDPVFGKLHSLRIIKSN